MNVLAIDQGTSSTKALVIGDDANVLAQSSAPVTPRSGTGGAVEQDPGELLQSIVSAGRAPLDAAHVPVDAGGLGHPSETVLRWGLDSRRAYRPALSRHGPPALTVTRALARG